MKMKAFATLAICASIFMADGIYRSADAVFPDSTGGIYGDANTPDPPSNPKAGCIAETGLAVINCAAGGINCGYAKVWQICNWYSPTERNCCKTQAQLEEARAEAKRKACERAVYTCNVMNIKRTCYEGKWPARCPGE